MPLYPNILDYRPYREQYGRGANIIGLIHTCDIGT